MNEHPEILLVGAGAVGSYYCGRLHKAGAKVSVVARSDYEVVKEKGFIIVSHSGGFTFKPEMVLKRADDYPRVPDYIVVSTKVLPGINVPELIKGAVGPDTSIVLLQNGIDIESHIAAAFPGNEIISGLAFICVSRPAPGEIDHQDYGRLVIGKYPGGKSAKVDLLCALFNSGGEKCEIDEDVIAARWKKLVWNAPFNPISVLAGGATTKEMLEDKETYALVERVMNEVVLLAEKRGHPLPANLVQLHIKYTQAMTPYKTSMLLDYENGREMEVEAILGNAVRAAASVNADVPCIRTLYALLRMLNNRRLS